MSKLTPIAASLLLCCALWPHSADAAADDIANLRAELDALKSDYASRVQALEARIKQLESAVAAVQAPRSADVPSTDSASAVPPPPAPFQPTVPPAPGKTGNATAFNPSISMILTGNYAHLSQDPATYRIAGFIPPTGEGPGARSFNLGESELTLASNVDPYFYANVTAAIRGDDSIGIEEAYFKTQSLNNGFTIKGGRFFRVSAT